MSNHPSLLALLESVGLGEQMEGTLRGRGVNTISALQAFGTEGLQTVEGIRAIQRKALITRANEVMNGTWQPSLDVPKRPPSPPPPPRKRRGSGFFGLFSACGCSGEPESPVPGVPPPASIGGVNAGSGQDSSAALEAALKAALQGALDIEESQLKEALRLEAAWRGSEGWQARFAAAEKSDDYDWLYVMHELQCEALQAVGLVPSQETLTRLREAALRYPDLLLPPTHDEDDSPTGPDDDFHLMSVDNDSRGPGPMAEGLAGLVERRGGSVVGEESMGSFGARGKRYSSEVYDSVCSDTPPDEALQFSVSRSMSYGAGTSPQDQEEQQEPVAGPVGVLGGWQGRQGQSQPAS